MNGEAPTQFAFGSFQLDSGNARLSRGGETVPLTPKAFDTLHYLAQHPDQLVTKDELLKAIWPDVIVGDASVKVCIREIRKALDDDAQQPKYIETVHRRGYRFIAKTRAPLPSAKEEAPAILVGRDEELHWLLERFEKAAGGARQTVFITGRPGSGKTALIEAFQNRVKPIATIAVGHCFEQFGTSEPYLPVWEALERLDPAAFRAGECAPVGLVGGTHGSSTRLLRDIVDCVERAASDRPVVLVHEDMQWADNSTHDVISSLARRRSPAKLMLICTYRHDEVLDPAHPLRVITRELLDRRLAEARPLIALSESAVADFVAQRAAHAPPAKLIAALHQRTGGHPLFLVQIVDELIGQGMLAGSELPVDAIDRLKTLVPASVVEMIDAQIESLEPAQRQMLERGAVAGVEFSAAAIVDESGSDAIVIAERVCEELSRRHRFLELRGVAEWPDGTVASAYRFAHELYHHVVHARIPAARRVQFHKAIGERLENAWADRAGEKAAELAVHFEQARDWPRAVLHLRRAAESASRQYAHREAIDYLRRAMTAVERLPEDERREHELPLLMSLAVNLQVTKGYAAPEIAALHERAYALSHAPGARRDMRVLFPVLWGMWVYQKVRSDLPLAQEIANELLSLADQENDDGLRLQAIQALAVTALCQGKFAETVTQMERAEKLYDPKKHSSNVRAFGQDPGVATFAFGALALCLVGECDRAIEMSGRAIGLARELKQPSSLALALQFAAMMHQVRGDAREAAKSAAEALELSTSEGYSFWSAGSAIVLGWARVAQSGDESGIDEIRKGLAAWLATGSRTYHEYFLGLLADALVRVGRDDEGKRVLDDALKAVEETGERLYEPQLRELQAKPQA
jgi:DNA-binding winged helix-turn-helix (wHTH) protein/predicted ATPase